MRALATGLALAAAALASPARAADPLAAETVEVRQVKGPLPADAAAPLWDGLPAAAATAAPQRSLRLHDLRANEALAAAGPRPLRVRAATDGTDLAVVVEWSDATEDRARPDATDAYGDGAALELPLRFGAGRRLPYVGMGDATERVAVYMQRAAAGGVVAREAVGAGYGSLTRADVGRARMAMRYDAAAKAWRAVFVRPLAAAGHDLRRGLVPFSLAVWDGGKQERGGNKALTRWKLLRLGGYPLDATYAAELSWGRAPGDLGSVAKGKDLVEGQCIACHVVGENRLAAPGLAPDLSAIGVISTPGYLRDSVVQASAVLVPTPNPAQRQDRGGKQDARGAWPADEGYVWYVEKDGRRSSAMPDFDALSKEEVADVVAYLVTLGEEPPGGRNTP
jgi:complex iron-sulfur molybdoenzyme family reductase subunit gamma